MQNFSHVLQEEHFQIGGWMDGGKKFSGKLATSQKRWEIGPRLLLITNRKWHTLCQTSWKSLTLDDLEGQYCNRNFFPSKAFMLWEKFAKPVSNISVAYFSTVAVYITWRDDWVSPRATCVIPALIVAFNSSISLI